MQRDIPFIKIIACSGRK